MLRGSIPLHWGHTEPISLRPKVELRQSKEHNMRDMRLHFESLFATYKSPVVVLDMIRQTPDRHMEAGLGRAFVDALTRLPEVHDEGLSEQPRCAAGDSPDIGDSSPSTSSPISNLISYNTDSDRLGGAGRVPGGPRTKGLDGGDRVVYMAYDWLARQAQLGFEGALRSLFAW
eukprot:Polyplicarium_translucidae@DN3532_c0_g1_i1.p1